MSASHYPIQAVECHIAHYESRGDYTSNELRQPIGIVHEAQLTKSGLVIARIALSDGGTHAGLMTQVPDTDNTKYPVTVGTETFPFTMRSWLSKGRPKGFIVPSIDGRHCQQKFYDVAAAAFNGLLRSTKEYYQHQDSITTWEIDTFESEEFLRNRS